MKLYFYIAGVVAAAVIAFFIYEEWNQKDLQLYSKGAVVYSPGKNKVLYDHNKDDRLHPASMTKVMSMLLVFEELQKGRLIYDQKLAASEKAVSTFASKAGLRTGESLSVDSLLKCVFLPSGSDAVLVFAEHLYGSEERFVEEMNRKVRELGLTNTRFQNSVGLEQPGHYSTAYDMAVIASELVTRFPEVYDYTWLSSAVIEREDGTELLLKNTNDMLDYDGVNGLKTGSTPNGGYSLTITYNKGNKHLVVVVMGSEMLYFRKADSKLLLDTFK